MSKPSKDEEIRLLRIAVRLLVERVDLCGGACRLTKETRAFILREHKQDCPTCAIDLAECPPPPTATCGECRFFVDCEGCVHPQPGERPHVLAGDPCCGVFSPTTEREIPKKRCPGCGIPTGPLHRCYSDAPAPEEGESDAV